MPSEGLSENTQVKANTGFAIRVIKTHGAQIDELRHKE
tara:strand:+ start:9899 stop:10012 length:114 start_codon:yes stop_codon:yes gene_type:complete